MSAARGSRECIKTVAFLLAFFAVIGYGFFLTFKESSFSSQDYVIVAPTDDVNRISNTLVERHICDNASFAKFVLKILTFGGIIVKVGEYELPDNVSVWGAIHIMATGKSVLHKFCIPEGFPVVRVLRKLRENKFLQGDITKIPEEGSLMPDTYCFTYPMTRQKIVDMAQASMRRFLEEEWKNRSPLCTLKSPQEVLTLASIVEKETTIMHDVIAGMYFNRLKINMKLQACPTAIYALVHGEKFARRLTYDELKTDDPYNTYVHEGLPPTPIANPGRKSILGVLHPKESPWLFMYYDKSMSKPVFAKDYAEHRKNIARIRQIPLSKIR